MDPDLVEYPITLDHLNKFGLVNVQSGLFPLGNVRATTSAPAQSRSESVITVNPRNSRNLIGVSKKFIDLAKYHFRLGPIFSFDGGSTWAESTLPMEKGWDGMTTDARALKDSYFNKGKK